MVGDLGATEPISSFLKPPAPREPTTIMSASLGGAEDCLGGRPTTASTVTAGGRALGELAERAVRLILGYLAGMVGNSASSG